MSDALAGAISWLAESILTVIVSVRTASRAVIVAIGAPVPVSVPSDQFEIVHDPDDAKLLMPASVPSLGFFK